MTPPADSRGTIALLDVDGTLADTNYQHALAWYAAFRSQDVTVPIWRLHRAVGMGGDQLVTTIVGEEGEARFGDELRAAWEQEVAPLLAGAALFPGAVDLVAELRRRGNRVVLASSGQAEQTEHWLGLLGGEGAVDAWTTSSDVQATKPAPDLVQVAVDKVGGGPAVMVGDSVWDVHAAARAGVPTLAVRTGGYGVDELREAGAELVVDSLHELLGALDSTPLSGR